MTAIVKCMTYDLGTRFGIVYIHEGQRCVRKFVIPPELRPYFKRRFG